MSFRLSGYRPEERNDVSLAVGGTVIVTMTLIPAPGESPRPAVDSGPAAVVADGAEAGTSTEETAPGVGSAAEETAITTRADLAIRASDSMDPVTSGTGLAYTVTVTNRGPSDARDVVVSSRLPAAVRFGSTTGCAEDPAGETTCTLGTSSSPYNFSPRAIG